MHQDQELIADAQTQVAVQQLQEAQGLIEVEQRLEEP